MITKLFQALFGWIFSIFDSKKRLVSDDSIPAVAYIKGVTFRPDRVTVLARAEPILLLTGTFFNFGGDTIKLLEIKVTAFDGQHVIGESETEVIGSHQADLRHGDSQAWEFRMPLTRAANRVEISTIEIEHSLTGPPPPPREARIDWEMKVPAGVLVVFKERLHRTQIFGDGRNSFCHLTIEVENSGKALRVLKLEINFLNQFNKVVDTREALAAWTGGPAIEPGERRLVHVISKVPSDYMNYVGRVVEVT